MTARRVYYNGACPVCRAGAARQRRRMAGSAVEWCDVDDEPAALAGTGVDVDAVRRRIHVEDNAGRLHVGAAACVALWRDTPGQHWLARLFSAPVVAAIGRWSYDAVAALLYRWNRTKRRW